LKKYNIYARKYFYPLTSKAKAFEGLFPIQETPNALKYSEKVLTLPFYGELSLRDVDRICKIILRGY
jgi:dTDP-4-amino-4,6-dideoxygalactose transaminase